MKIETKYSINDTVFFLADNKILTGGIIAVHITVNKNVHVKYDVKCVIPDDSIFRFYNSCNGFSYYDFIWVLGGKLEISYLEKQRTYISNKKKRAFLDCRKKFLCFFVKNDLFGLSQFFKTKEEAIKKLSEYIQELDEVQNSEYIFDYNKFISDPKRLIEGRKLKTKRISNNNNQNKI